MLTADIATKRGNHKAALPPYRQAWDKAPSDQIGMKLYSSMRENGEPDATFAGFFDDWAEKIPGQLGTMTRAGHDLENGDLSRAQSSYQALVAVNPNNAIAYNNLAWTYGEDALTESLKASQRAYDLAPQSGEILDTYGWFLYKSGDIKKGL